MSGRSILRGLSLASLALWISLAVIVSVSGLLYPGGAIRNLVMGAIFAVIGAGAHLLQTRPRLRFGPWLLGISLPAGATLALMASYRFFSEGMAVFG